MANECTCRYTGVGGDVLLACRYPWKFNHAALLWNTMCFSRNGIPTAQRYTPRICMFNAASVGRATQRRDIINIRTEAPILDMYDREHLTQ